jgi:hypothetical protein
MAEAPSLPYLYALCYTSLYVPLTTLQRLLDDDGGVFNTYSSAVNWMSVQVTLKIPIHMMDV